MPVFVVAPGSLGASIMQDHEEMKAALVDGIRTTVKLHGPRIAQALVGAETPPPVDRGTYRRSFKVSDIRDGVSLYNFAMHAPIIEDGRRPGGKMPPIDVIAAWVMRKGIGIKSGPTGTGARRLARKVGAAEARGLAFVIARKIAARGLRAHHILARTVKELEPFVEKTIAAALGRV